LPQLIRAEASTSKGPAPKSTGGVTQYRPAIFFELFTSQDRATKKLPPPRPTEVCNITIPHHPKDQKSATPRSCRSESRVVVKHTSSSSSRCSTVPDSQSSSLSPEQTKKRLVQHQHHINLPATTATSTLACSIAPAQICLRPNSSTQITAYPDQSSEP
jgi:hypothetical protein